MSHRQMEVTIPVKRDDRTFEEQRKDMFTNLQRRTSSRINDRSQGANSDTTATSLSLDSGFTGRDDWNNEVNNWTNQTLKRWDDQMRRTRQDMFALEPVDHFDLDAPWPRMGSLSGFDHNTDPDSMFAKMEREMEMVRRQMGGLGHSRFPTGGNSSSVQSSSSRVVTSSSTTSSGDPKNMQTTSNVQESTKHSRTIDGVTTGTSSQSSMSSTSKGPNKVTESGTPGALISRSQVTGGTGINFLKDAYEVAEDGQVHFKVHFDAKDFSPEDIDVSTVDNRLTVHAKKATKVGESTSEKEFKRTIELPRSIDHENFQCNITDDGVLILDAPVKVPDYQAITFDQQNQLGIRPQAQSVNSNKATGLDVLGKAGPIILKDGSSGRKLHLEIPIEEGYAAEDLCVRMDDNRITVSGKSKQPTGTQRKITQCEFSRSYEVPETVDPFSVTAQLYNTTLIIEAPLLSTM